MPGACDRGASMTDLLAGFLASREFVQRETGTRFQGILGLDAARTELVPWSAAMLAGRDPLRSGLASLLASSEAFRRIGAKGQTGIAVPESGWLCGLSGKQNSPRGRSGHLGVNGNQVIRRL